jgi:hypothetical protein
MEQKNGRKWRQQKLKSLNLRLRERIKFKATSFDKLQHGGVSFSEGITLSDGSTIWRGYSTERKQYSRVWMSADKKQELSCKMNCPATAIPEALQTEISKADAQNLSQEEIVYLLPLTKPQIFCQFPSTTLPICDGCHLQPNSVRSGENAVANLPTRL